MDNKEQETVSVKAENQIHIEYIFWTAGFLFTIGIVSNTYINDMINLNLNFFDKVGFWIGFYILWPFILGLHFA